MNIIGLISFQNNYMAIRFCNGVCMTGYVGPKVHVGIRMFDEIKSLFLENRNIIYIPIFDSHDNFICESYDDKNCNEHLFHINTMKNSKYALQLFSQFKYVSIYSCNELSYEFYNLCISAGCKVNLYGDLWKYLIKDDSVQHTCHSNFTLYAEGNCGLPVKEQGMWKNAFPYGEFVQLENIYNNLSSNKLLYNKKIKDGDTSNHIISNMIHSRIPFMASRLGNTESRITFDYINGRISKLWLSWLYSSSGFYSDTDGFNIQDIIEYSKLTIKSLKACDIHMCKFDNAIALLNILSHKDSIFVDWYDSYLNLNSDECWLKALCGKKVLIVSSINSTIKKQFNNFRKIHNVSYELDFDPIYYDCPETYFVEDRLAPRWFDMFNKIKDDILDIDFDIAIISAGSYGHPLAAHIKEIGRQSINLCSGIYPLFGIRNKTQTIVRKVSSLYNSNWIFPIKEKDRDYMNIEKGAYWE